MQVATQHIKHLGSSYSDLEHDVFFFMQQYIQHIKPNITQANCIYLGLTHLHAAIAQAMIALHVFCAPIVNKNYMQFSYVINPTKTLQNYPETLCYLTDIVQQQKYKIVFWATITHYIDGLLSNSKL